jgi:uncharacterized protein YeaO (DUF488 family)
MMSIKLKRVYDAPSKEDGVRILVDRLWPRGITKENLAVDLWLKDLAPSTELRKWFSHDPLKWAEFQEKYAKELEASSDAVENLAREVRKGTVTLLYSSKEAEHNNAVALKRYLERKPAKRAKTSS